MLKGQDIVILLKLLAHPEEKWNMLRLSKALKMNYSTLHQAVERLRFARLVGQSFEDGRLVVDEPGAKRMLANSISYFFPAREGALAVGLPTAAAAPVFQNILVQNDQLPPVWPCAQGTKRGVALAPLTKNVPVLALEDPVLYDLLAIVDTLRSGSAREIEQAQLLLGQIAQ